MTPFDNEIPLDGFENSEIFYTVSNLFTNAVNYIVAKSTRLVRKARELKYRAKNEKGKDLSSYVKKNYDFRPLAIIEKLKLRNPIYQQTAAYGHFGKKGLPWEKIES